jgi:hypothetical protein
MEKRIQVFHFLTFDLSSVRRNLMIGVLEPKMPPLLIYSRQF